jgi:hypothetical protein
MRLPHCLLALLAGLAWTLGGPAAWADIYKWVDDEGAVTFSNVPPKDRSRIVEVFPSSEWPQSNPPAAPATRQTEELRSLAESVDRLARILEDERRFSDSRPAAYTQYAAAAPPMWDGGWDGWGGWWNGGWYGPTFFSPAPLVVVGTSHRFPHFNKFHHFPKAHHFRHGAARPHPHAVVRTGGGARFQAAGGARFQGARGGGRMR